MSTPFPEPTDAASTRTEVMVRYLDYFRDQVASKVEGIPVDEQRVTRVPSGWTPVQLLKHLTHVEQRWLEWGFEGAAIPTGEMRDALVQLCVRCNARVLNEKSGWTFYP